MRPLVPASINLGLDLRKSGLSSIRTVAFPNLHLLFCEMRRSGTVNGGEAGPLVSGLGPKVSGCWPGMRPHKAFDLASVFHHALCCCPWYLSEHDATGSTPTGLALWAAFQPKGWIYADSSTLTFPDAVFSGFYCRIEQVSQPLRHSLFDLHKPAKVGKPKGTC